MKPIVVLTAILLGLCSAAVSAAEPLTWTRLPDLPEPLGVAGPFAGVSNDALIVAGGAHFPVSLFSGGKKAWVDKGFVLDRSRDAWHTGYRLHRPIAYGASVTTDDGLICIGGCDAQKHYADVFRLRWAEAKLQHSELPRLPRPCAFTSAALVGSTVYVAGGIDKPNAATALRNFWALDLAKPDQQWQALEPWPGPGRMLSVAGSLAGSFYLFSGCELLPGKDGKTTRRYLTDAYRYRPGKGWARIADLPRPAVAAPTPAMALDASSLIVFGGDDGQNADKVWELKDKHPGFCRDVLVYDITTDTWGRAGSLPAAHVTTPAVPWAGAVVMPSGEVRPGVRSPKVYEARPHEGGEARAIFVGSGVAKLVRVEGKPWRQGKGYVECSGLRNYLWAGRRVRTGDFHIRARLTLVELAHTAASFTIGNQSHFGFDGGNRTMFVEGRYLSRRARYLPNTKDIIKPGEPFLFEMAREGADVRFLINGQLVHRARWPRRELGMIGFRPWRSTMKVHDFSVEGDTGPLPAARTQPLAYTIPTLDLGREPQRQVVIARGTAQVYQGHPSTVLMADGKTMFAAWTYDHGGCCGPLKKSVDGGLTWSDLIPVPENWAKVRNCPTIHRLTDPNGVERLFVFAGNGDMYQSVSEDAGATWSPMAKNGLHCVVAPITIMPIAGGRLLAHYHRGANDRDSTPLTIWQSVSADGGITWGPERKVGEFEGADLCEPAIIRSPDGRQLASIMRENTRRYNSFIMFSRDEGETWSTPVEVPASLTGDRHMPRYAADGRLVMCFRDTCQRTPTRGDFVAWIGTYDDLVQGREGQYRVRLLDSPVKGDLGYPGLELLPDGTFVATTYAVLKPEEKHSVVSVRFKMQDIDAKARNMPKQAALFVAGKDGCHTYRIPALARTNKGTLLAFCEGRRKSAADHGDIGLVLKRSFDNGETWSDMQVVHGDGEHTIGNPCPVVDTTTGTVWLLFCRDNDRVLVTHSDDDGATWAAPMEITKDVKLPDWTWYATGPCHGVQLKSGRLLIPCDHRVRSEGRVMYSHVIYSDDHGATWKLAGSLPKGTDECVAVETADGSVYLNMRSYAGRNRRAVAWSRDGGDSWSPVQLDETLVEPVCQASAVRYTQAQEHDKNRVLFSNPASTSRLNMVVRVSYDECKAWGDGQVLWPGPSAYSDLCVAADMSICCLYERGDEHAYETITFARFGLEWLSAGKDRLK